MPTPTPTPDFVCQLELIEDTIEYEYRNSIYWGPSGLIKTPQRREVHTKTYEGTVKDKQGRNVTEVPQPDWLDTYFGQADSSLNPGNLSPLGNDANKWHIDNKSYTHELSTPLSRVVRIVWVKNSAWAAYETNN